MPDPRFFAAAAPLTLAEALALAGVTAPADMPDPGPLGGTAPLHLAGPGDIAFLADRDLLPVLAASRAGVCLIHPDLVARAPAGVRPLLVPCPDPGRAHARLARHFHPEPPVPPGIAASALVDPSAAIGAGVAIGPGAVIGAGATIGAGTAIAAGAVIEAGVVLGAGCRIGALASLSHALVGARVVVRDGARIGGAGFGFVPGPGGLEPVPQLGRVVIGDDVEIGANTTIDRGAGDDTVIGNGTKIDNLVMIAHNCRIGAHCVLAGQVGLSGSVTLGDGVMLGGQVGVADHVTIGAGARVAAKSGVMRDIPAGATQAGYPAGAVQDWHRQTAALRRLGRGGKGNRKPGG